MTATPTVTIPAPDTGTAFAGEHTYCECGALLLLAVTSGILRYETCPREDWRGEMHRRARDDGKAAA